MAEDLSISDKSLYSWVAQFTRSNAPQRAKTPTRTPLMRPRGRSHDRLKGIAKLIGGATAPESPAPLPPASATIGEPGLAAEGAKIIPLRLRRD